MNKAKTAFDAAAKHLHEKKTFAYKDKPVKALHSALNDVLNHGFELGLNYEIPNTLLQSLKNDIFLFSGMKTYAELKEASQLLTTPDGFPKPFNQFAQDVAKINSAYNERYLEAEWHKANASAETVAHWQQWEDEGDFNLYNLQIRTAGDDKVRPKHQLLNMITLPMDDPFWLTHSTPFDWFCRCIMIKVLKSKYPATDSNEAMKTGDNVINDIFRFNPAKQKIIFPKKHPYYAQHCGKKLNVTGNIELAMIVLNNEKEKCEFQKDVKAEAEAKAKQRSEQKAKNKELIKWSHSQIRKGEYKSITGDQFISEVRISRSNIESIIKHIADVKNKEIVKDIDSVLSASTFVNQAALGEGVDKSSKNIGHKRARGVTHYRYYKGNWNGIDIEINMEVMKDGYEQPYSIDIIKK